MHFYPKLFKNLSKIDFKHALWGWKKLIYLKKSCTFLLSVPYGISISGTAVCDLD